MVAGSVRTRCVVVATGLTAAAWGAAAVLAPALSTAPARTADAGLVRLCVLALLLALGWGWMQGLAAIGEAWRGAVSSPRCGTVRRLVLAACGVAVVTVLAGSVSEAAPPPTRPGHPRPHGPP